ncbi:MAG: phosphatidylserine decarboxylase family protein [Peptococcaceae bacterium]|nr:phosphatidylserine decarboxylase family protein [Peptococcaceae bacterium]MDH7525716.1 phosphatidylserine decarboxylase family protein [Peptococcaceae bacterium]
MKRDNWPVMPDAFPFVIAGIVLAAAAYLLFGYLAALLPAFFTVFVLYFFRNPERNAQAAPGEVISPADGVVLIVEEVEEPRYLQGPAVKVSIFMNVFNVHVNRSPIQGRVEYVHYQPGKFLPAFKGHASQLNERNYVGIRSETSASTALLVVQVTGFIARRVVCWVKAGDRLEQGQRFGLIKFGSCVEVYLPRASIVSVEPGQKVRGGKTIIGRVQYG